LAGGQHYDIKCSHFANRYNNSKALPIKDKCNLLPPGSQYALCVVPGEKISRWSTAHHIHSEEQQCQLKRQ